ncbi:phosphoribosylglycinamide formyltransferase [bacterium]|nr:phosphoribosylglycinamide formyltransferase [bacterium]
MYKIAVLSSTNGTDLQAIIDEMKAGKMEGIELSVVISNRKSAYALERAKEQGYDTVFVSPRDKTREEFDKEMAVILKEKGVDLICLIGYMRILSSWFVREFEGKIINVHPAINMKKYAGLGAMNLNVHKAVIENGEKESGCTIHYVTEGVDEGPIIAQADVLLEEGETPESLKGKVQAQEKLLYPEVIRRFARGE